MNPTPNSVNTIYYADSKILVQEGDVVEYKSRLIWRGWIEGHVSYVPGVSEFHPEMEHHGFVYIGFTGVDNTFRPINVDQERDQVKASIRFVSRGDLDGILRPKDIKPDEW